MHPDPTRVFSVPEREKSTCLQYIISPSPIFCTSLLLAILDHLNLDKINQNVFKKDLKRLPRIF